MQKGQNPGGLLVLPTGGGKSFVATYFACAHPLSDGYRILWLAHTNYLLEQALESFNKTIPLVDSSAMPIKVRVVSGSPEHFKPDHIQKDDNVLICTLQTATRAFKKQQPKFIDFIRAANDGSGLFVIFDEAHHAPAHTYRALLKSIKDMCSPFGLLGLTATPTRSDERKQGWLNRLFPDRIIAQTDAHALLADQILAKPIPVEIHTTVEPEFDEHEYKKWSSLYRDLPESIINNLADNNSRNEIIVNHYVKNKKTYGKTIMFADRWWQCVYLENALERHNIRAGSVFTHIVGRAARRGNIDYPHPTRTNAEIIKSFKNNDLDVLINVQMLTEGIDVPDAQTVFLTRQTTSDILLKQMVGRALRGPRFGGTDKAHIVSFIDNWKHAINWSTYEQIMEGATDDEPPERRLRAQLQLISVDLIRRLTQQMYSGRSVNPYPYKTFLPLGWYKVEYEAVVVGDYNDKDGIREYDDDTETVRKLVMVYDHDADNFRRFIIMLHNRRINNALQDFEPSDLVRTKDLDRKLQSWQKEFFGDDDDRLDGTTADLLHLARHVAQQDDEPDLVRFEQRDDHDLDVIASDYVAQDLGTGTVDRLLQREFDRSDRFWKIMYPDYVRFKFQYDFCVNRILHPKHAADSERNHLPYEKPENIPEIEPSDEIKEMVKKRDRRCLCCWNESRLEVDHIIPKYFDMNHKLDNLQALCRTCNILKSDTSINFRKQQTRLSSAPCELPNVRILDVQDARDVYKWQLYLCRVVNFFYCCSAVAEIDNAAKGERFHTWNIMLFPGNDPDWIRPHMGNIANRIRQARSDAGVMPAPQKIIVNGF